MDFSTVTSAPPLVVSVLQNLCILCGKCNAHIILKDYHSHSCADSPAAVMPGTSLEELLKQPSSAPLTPLEQKLQTNLARRSLVTSSSEEGVLQLKTGGKVGYQCLWLNQIIIITKTLQPLTFIQVRQAQVPSGQAASCTVRKRSKSISSVRCTLAGGDEIAQMGDEIREKSRAEREQLMQEIRDAGGDFQVQVPAQSALAMKADLNIPWHKLRIIRR